MVTVISMFPAPLSHEDEYRGCDRHRLASGSGAGARLNNRSPPKLTTCNTSRIGLRYSFTGLAETHELRR